MSVPDPEEMSLEDRAGQQDRAGWGPIPLPTGKKAQPPVGFTGGHPVPSYADWYTIYEESPTKWGNLGARIPERVVGVDVDAYSDKNGAATWDLLGGKDFEPTVVLSARFTVGYDGLSGIRFYLLPQGITQDMLWGAHDGIEILRLSHRYAVSPGSLHPTGSFYRLFDQRTKTFLDVMPAVDSLPTLTVEQATLLTVEGAPWAGETAAERGHDDNPMCHYTTTILNRALGNMKHEDSRYGTMSNAVWALVKGEDEGHHLGEALDILKFGYVSAVGKDRREAGHEPPWSEFDRNMSDAYRKVGANPTDEMFKACCATELTAPEPLSPDVDEAVDDDEVVELTAYDKAVRAEYANLRVREDARTMLTAHALGEAKPIIHLPLRDFLDQPDEDEPYRVQDLWPLHGRTMLAAGAKTGKTTLVVSNLIPSLADGTPFLGKYEVQQVTGRIVYFNLEVSPRTLRVWMRRAGIVNIDAVEVVNLRGLASALTLATPQGRKRLSTFLRDVGGEVAVLDPLAPLLAALGLDENSNANVATFYNWWNETMHDGGIVEDMIVHHTGHSGDRSRGASRLLDEPDAIWTLTKDLNGETEESRDGGIWDMPQTRFLQAIGRDVDLPAEELSFDPITGLLTLTGVAKTQSIRRTRKDSRSKSTLEQTRELLSDGVARTKSAIQAHITGNTNAKSALVQDLIDMGFLYDSGNRTNGRTMWMWTDNPNGDGE